MSDHIIKALLEQNTKLRERVKALETVIAAMICSQPPEELLTPIDDTTEQQPS
ncbi:MAG: hypothetical protein WCJ62_00170 [Flavobacterium sp.]